MGIWQLKHFMMSKYFQHQINAFAIGSAQPNYGPSHLKQMSIIAPTKEISDKYENKVSSFEKLINLLVKKNNIFTKTRDYLLPKLISGKIDVSDLDIDTSIIND
jgi:type I restriction enzyme S subunit